MRVSWPGVVRVNLHEAVRFLFANGGDNAPEFGGRVLNGVTTRESLEFQNGRASARGRSGSRGGNARKSRKVAGVPVAFALAFHFFLLFFFFCTFPGEVLEPIVAIFFSLRSEYTKYYNICVYIYIYNMKQKYYNILHNIYYSRLCNILHNMWHNYKKYIYVTKLQEIQQVYHLHVTFVQK